MAISNAPPEFQARTFAKHSWLANGDEYWGQCYSGNEGASEEEVASAVPIGSDVIGRWIRGTGRGKGTVLLKLGEKESK